MRKEIILCDSCGEEIGGGNVGAIAGPCSGEAKNGRAFSFDLDFHAMTHGSPPRSGISRPGAKPDLCRPCAVAIVESALKTRERALDADAA